MRSPSRFLQLGLLLFGVSSCAPALADDAARHARATLLVEQLGQSEFALRERASAELVHMGVSAMEALKAGTSSRDREVRERSKRILALVADVDFAHRLRLFEADTESQQGYDLPAWPEFRDLVGTDAAARALFVMMQEEEPLLLAKLGEQARVLNAVVSQRAEELRQRQQFGGEPIKLGTTAVMLFVAGDPRVDLTTLRATLYTLCRDTTFEAAIQSGPQRPGLVRLVERWMSRQDAEPAAFVLDISLRCGISACLPRARAALKQPGSSQTDRLYGCLCIAKFGDREDCPLLEAQLEDVTICAQGQIDQQIIITQLCDIALAALIHLTGQDFADFGFDHVQRDRDVVFHVSSLGFRDDASRQRAQAAWRDYRDKAKPAK